MTLNETCVILIKQPVKKFEIYFQLCREYYYNYEAILDTYVM